jgi:hypothetical protein
MASPPLPWWLAALFGLAFLLRTISRMPASQAGGWNTFRKSAASVFILLLVGITMVEYFHRRLPRIQGAKSDHLVVIGDSISAGLGTRESIWPEVMERATGSTINNLSIPGATLLNGVRIADHLTSQDQLVLVELGGNDLLSGEPSRSYGRSLDKLPGEAQFPRAQGCDVRTAAAAAHDWFWTGAKTTGEQVWGVVDSQTLSSAGSLRERCHFRRFAS